MKLRIEKAELQRKLESDAVPRVGDYVKVTDELQGYVRTILWVAKGKKLEAVVRLDR